MNINNDDLLLDFFSKTFIRKDRIDISVECVTGLENDADETIWINVRARGQTFLLCNTYRPEWMDNGY